MAGLPPTPPLPPEMPEADSYPLPQKSLRGCRARGRRRRARSRPLSPRAPRQLVGATAENGVSLCSAQRLPASKRFSLLLVRKKDDVALVLNAFRHQSGSHQRRRVGVLAERLVLNAFRHQSGSHHGLHHGDRRRLHVLNACRHQSGSHCAVVASASRVVSCSTPSGIKAVLTWR